MELTIEEKAYLSKVKNKGLGLVKINKAREGGKPLPKLSLGKIRNKYDPILPKEYKAYLKRCTSRSIIFDLTVEQFYNIARNNCTYCNIPGPNGIDRIVPNLGYTINNTVPCCKKCNTMKFIYSKEEFLKHVERICKHQGFTI